MSPLPSSELLPPRPRRPPSDVGPCSAGSAAVPPMWCGPLAARAARLPKPEPGPRKASRRALPKGATAARRRALPPLPASAAFLSGERSAPPRARTDTAAAASVDTAAGAGCGWCGPGNRSRCCRRHRRRRRRGSVKKVSLAGCTAARLGSPAPRLSSRRRACPSSRLPGARRRLTTGLAAGRGWAGPASGGTEVGFGRARDEDGDGGGEGEGGRRTKRVAGSGPDRSVAPPRFPALRAPARFPPVLARARWARAQAARAHRNAPRHAVLHAPSTPPCPARVHPLQHPARAHLLLCATCAGVLPCPALGSLSSPPKATSPRSKARRGAARQCPPARRRRGVHRQRRQGRRAVVCSGVGGGGGAGGSSGVGDAAPRRGRGGACML